MKNEVKSISIAQADLVAVSSKQKAAVATGLVGLFILMLALLNVQFPNKSIWLAVALLSIIAGVILYANELYLKDPAGIKNNGLWFKSLTSRGMLGWATGILLTGFYIVIYWYPQYLGLNEKNGNTGIVAFFDPLKIGRAHV